jgi:GH43 family beta-xylosidase
VLENPSPDPTRGAWTPKGRIYAPDADFWAIDATVLEHEGARYLVWSGRPDAAVQDQNLYIARMTSPWTLAPGAVLLSKPELAWERQGPVNEGPEALKGPGGRVFLVYSAAGCWTDDYSLGLLSLKPGGDPMKPGDWTKSTSPVFSKSPERGVYGPGHNSFFKSPDGKEDWIVYHANSRSGQGCGEKRTVRMQRFTWGPDGTPDFGAPSGE